MADQPPVHLAPAAEGGAVVRATQRELEALHEAHSARGQVALVLARALDDGAGMATAAVAKELRATLKELTPDVAGDDFTRLMESLSASVRDTSTS